MSQCLRIDTLVAFIEGRLRGAEAMDLQEHIDKCPLCLEEIDLLVGQNVAVANSHGESTNQHPISQHDKPAASAEESNHLAPPARRGLRIDPPQQLEEYRSPRALGHGGMGEVFVYEDTMLQRLVAIKFISSRLQGTAARERFFIEARAVARLSHPNVLTVYRVGELSGLPFLVTEYVHGKSLAQIDKPISWQESLRIGTEIARGLAAAHQRGVLHRDIKPSNIMLTEQQDVKILDFGLAKLLADAPARTEQSPEAPASVSALPDESHSVTNSGTLLGTPLYMAPELWRRESATQRSDVYSVGAVLYELCTGNPPHSGSTLSELKRNVRQVAVPSLSASVPAADRRFVAIVDRCLAREPEARFADGVALSRALEGVRIQVGTIPPGNPYRGLAVFDAVHRPLFFGRTSDARECLAHLSSEPLLMLTGDSGCGKSSLCRAGILPLIVEGAFADGRRWNVAELVPGRQPLRALARALSPVSEQSSADLLTSWQSPSFDLLASLERRLSDRDGLVIFIDQMEELVTQSNESEAHRFCTILESLFVHSYSVRVLLTVRSDFLENVVALLHLTRDVKRYLHWVHPLAESGLREAIVGPAEFRDVRFASDAIVEELIRSTVQESGGLPLLQFALSELWEVRDERSGVIPDGALRAIGGVSGSLARHADRIYANLSAAKQSAVRRMMSKLVTVQGTRARRFAEELLTDSPNDQDALDALVNGRLVIAREDETARPSFEIAHEALIEGWGLLRTWLSEDGELRALLQRLSIAAADWERLDRDGSALWNDRKLKEGLTMGLLQADLPVLENEFLVASQRAARRRQMLQIGAVVGTVSLLLAARQISRWEADQSFLKTWNDTQAAHEHAQQIDQEGQKHRAAAFAQFLAKHTEQGEQIWAQYMQIKPKAIKAFSEAENKCFTAFDQSHDRKDVREYCQQIRAKREDIEGRDLAGIEKKVESDPRAEKVVPYTPPEGFAYIPRGRFYYGFGDAVFSRARLENQPQQLLETDGFFVSITEVTFADYLRYLETLSPEQQERRGPHLSGADRHLRIERDTNGTWHLTVQPESAVTYRAAAGELIEYRSRTYHQKQNWLRFPVVGISYQDAVAYTEWLSAHGVPGARLCTEYEWERAARGTDARLFPNGNWLAPEDANFRKTHGGDAVGFGPDEVHSHKESDSPFGVADLAGNVWEWVTNSESDVPSEKAVYRGGSWSDGEPALGSMNRTPSDLLWRSMRVGIRVCASLPKSKVRAN